MGAAAQLWCESGAGHEKGGVGRGERRANPPRPRRGRTAAANPRERPRTRTGSCPTRSAGTAQGHPPVTRKQGCASTLPNRRRADGQQPQTRAGQETPRRPHRASQQRERHAAAGPGTGNWQPPPLHRTCTQRLHAPTRARCPVARATTPSPPANAHNKQAVRGIAAGARGLRADPPVPTLLVCTKYAPTAYWKRLR